MNSQDLQVSNNASQRSLDKNSPIGIFDSGVGGLSVLKQINSKLPHESVIYFGDTAHVPYGGRPLEEVKGFALSICNFLVSNDVKMIIMACNISSAVAIEHARLAHPDLPIIGVIEPGSSASLRNGVGSVGVLATRGTVSSGAYTKAISQKNPAVRVTEIPCPEFVPLVESENTESIDAYHASLRYLAPLARENAEIVILGCTHYPFLLKALTTASLELFPKNNQPVFVDPAIATADETKSLLCAKTLVTDRRTNGERRYYVSGDPEQFRSSGSQFLGSTIELAEQISLL